MKHKHAAVEIWEESVIIPTYKIGEADRNPMFLEKRVYQGSSGKVYPLPVIDKIKDEKEDKSYAAVWLENDYLKVMVLPELGGRIHRAYDKTNKYDFVYYNEVIKPALVGLTGPWISGGIEFNWPQHHRPTTFCPVDYLLCENEDGSKTVRLNETDRMYGTKSIASITLYPDKAYIEISGQLYNPTDLPQTFLWWANPAVAVNDNTRSIFPPDVHAVMDHGKRAVSRFPVATGEYYKHDYGSGVDISRYKNIPVPTSYMAYHSDYDFVGHYDFGVQAGILHVADHHISPGKKQWTWGSGDFGKAWDRNLTDCNGPYIELMTGVFTDNQPDFTWLMPYERKQFVQYFMPYKQVGDVKNASIEAAMNLQVQENTAEISIYATAIYKDAEIVLMHGDKALFTSMQTLSPVDVFSKRVDINNAKEHELTLILKDSSGRIMLSYTPEPEKIHPVPEPAQSAKEPREIQTVEELYLTALHIEQYRHATYLPDPYYLEGLRRDAGDSRINTAYGMLLLRRGLFNEAETYFRNSVKRLTWKNPNPYTSQAHYGLGLSLMYQGRESEAFDAFYKSTWTSAEQEMGFYQLAVISSRSGETEKALEFVNRSLMKNIGNVKARGLKGILLKKLGRRSEAHSWLSDNLTADPFDYVSRFERDGFADTAALKLMRGNADTFLDAAACYAEFGCHESALSVLKQCLSQNPLVAYGMAYYAHLCGDREVSAQYLQAASDCPPDYCFPNKLRDIAVLKYAINESPKDARARYYLGNLMYDKLQYKEAQILWEKSVEMDPSFPTAWRNLSLAYYNKQGDYDKAQKAMETAFSLNPSDARIFLELDQLYKKRGMRPLERLKHYEADSKLIETRDDLLVEYITLLNLVGRYKDAYECIMNHKFHPWEGGEGKITAQYSLCLMEMARDMLAKKNSADAIALLERALCFPENLGEGKLEGSKDNNVYYYLGCAHAQKGDMDFAKNCWEKAATGSKEPGNMMYYNDQPADMIFYQGLALEKLGSTQESRGRFHKLINYGEKHIFDDVRIEYFAVSLPDLQLFEEDLNKRNKANCYYLIALGQYGLGNAELALSSLNKTLELDCAHIGAIHHHSLIKQNDLMK